MTTPGFSSGTYNYGNTAGGGPPLSELLLDAYERCGKIGIELTSHHIQSGRRSMNLVLSSWANRGPNLWTVTQFVQFMPQNVGQYVVPPQVIDVMADSISIRQYQMGAPSAVTPAFTTTAGSTFVTVTGLPATPAAGQYISVGVMTAIGGIIMDGLYQVASVPGTNQATVQIASAAISTATGGTVPLFATTAKSPVVTVTLTSHGLLAGQSFAVEVQTSVGGLTLLGSYAVASVTSADQFTIVASYPAGSTASVYENGGKTNLATQASQQFLSQSAAPVDIMLFVIARGDYMAIPVKSQPGRPTSVWVDRQISPVINVWPVPDATGPYELRYRATRQIQDADITSGQALNVPYRMLEAFTSAVAAHLAQKWAPERVVALSGYAEEQWVLASDEDRERVPTYISGDMTSYYE